jgi:hypothetical protein
VEFNTCLNLTNPQFVTSTNPKANKAPPPRQRFAPPAQSQVPGFRPAPAGYGLSLFLLKLACLTILSFQSIPRCDLKQPESRWRWTRIPRPWRVCTPAAASVCCRSRSACRCPAWRDSRRADGKHERRARWWAPLWSRTRRGLCS